MSSILDYSPSNSGAKAAEEISANARALREHLINSYNGLMGMFWGHPTASPQEICDALGERAGSLFAYGAALAAFIEQIDPVAAATLRAPANAFTVAADGRVTISSEPYQAA